MSRSTNGNRLGAKQPATDPLAGLARAVVRYRWAVLIAWLVIIGVSGGLFGAKASSVLKGGGFDVPGSDSDKAATILQSQFNQSTWTSVVAVFHSDTMTVDQPAFSDQVKAATDRLSSQKYVVQVLSYFNTLNPSFISPDHHTTFAIVALKGKAGQVDTLVPDVRDQLKPMTVSHYVTGVPAINADTFVISEQDLSRAEVFTIPIVLILLLIVFRTVVAAVIPLILGVAGIVVTTTAVYFIGSATDTSVFALNVSSLIGLGLGIDYALIVISRYRSERAARGEVAAAVEAAMRTAGRSIMYSGLTVVLAMLVLTVILFNLMIVRSISLAVTLVALFALAAALTLLPALLAILGDKLEWLPVLPRRKPAASNQGGWYRLSHQIMKRPVAWLLVALVFLGVLASPIRDLRLVGANTGALPSSVESAKGAATMDKAFGSNELNPIQILVKAKDKNGVWNPQFLSTLEKLTKTVGVDPRTESVSSLYTVLAAQPESVYLKSTPEDFAPAPPIPADPTQLPTIPLIDFQTVLDVQVDPVPPPTAYIGYARFNWGSGAGIPTTSVPSQNVVVVESGTLQVTAGGTTRLVAKGSGTSSNPPVNQAFTLTAPDALIMPANTPVSIHAQGAASFIDATIFTIRSLASDQTSWLGSPEADLFRGMPRELMGGGATDTLPAGPVRITVDRAVTQPGAFFNKHLHPGPEEIYVQSGTLTVYSSPQMTVTAADGSLENAAFDTPLPLTAGGKALVQGYGVHRARNLGTSPAVIYSTRFTDPALPPYVLIGPSQAVSQVVNLNGNNDTAVITIISKYGQYDQRHQDYVYDLRNRIVPEVVGSNYQVLVGGDAALFLDFRDSLYNRFPLIVALVTLIIFAILLMFFQSIFLPLKAMFMNLATIIATYGVLVVIFQSNEGAKLLNFTPQGMVNVITPAILFVVLFALSTDYEVFMLSRVREHYLAGASNEEAVATGLQRTAGVITAAGLILVGTFGSFAAADIEQLKEIGLGLAIGVLLDSTVVRLIMVPATMRLAGRANWWMPEGLRRFVPQLSEGEETPAAPAATEVVAQAQPVAAAPAPPAAALKVMVDSLEKTVALSGDAPVRIGRGSDNELQLIDDAVSRHHAEVRLDDGHFTVADLNSRNGVFVNGQAVAAGPAGRALQDGDEIRLGHEGPRITFSQLKEQVATVN